MKSEDHQNQTVIGAATGGGFYAGRIRVGDVLYALVVAPKAEGEIGDAAWNKSLKSITGSLSYCDGPANTRAMAEGGSPLAQWALDLRVGGNDDWYLPSQDELEIIYRSLKPTDTKNWCYARSGINVSAEIPTYPYTPDFPVKTPAGSFRQGGSEAFEPAWYWSSTQHASASDCAWYQYFNYGSQTSNHKTSELRARAVRRLVIE